MSYKKTVVYIGSLVSLLFILIIIFNATIDSSGYFFGNNKLKDVAIKMNDGYNVAGIENNTGRTLNKYRIQTNEKIVETISLGSSRCYFLNSSHFNDVFSNHCMSSANLNDILAIIGIYKKEKGYIPKNIVLNIDPWIFDNKSGQGRWQWLDLKEYYFFMLNELGDSAHQKKERDFSKKYKLLASYGYTKDNLKSFFEDDEKIFFEKDYKKLTKYKYIKRADGSLIQNRIKELDLKSAAKQYIKSLNEFTELSNKEIFESFINYLLENGSKISFLLTPFHNDVYTQFQHNDKLKGFMKSELYINKLAKKYNIEIKGSLNPMILNLDTNSFIDALHCKEEVINGIMNR